MSDAWTCASCGVSVSFAAGFEGPEAPEGWVPAGEGWQCLGCRRNEVVEAAAAAGGSGSAAARKRALTEFELKRDPSASDQLIAKRAKCSTQSVVPIRAALESEGLLPPA